MKFSSVLKILQYTQWVLGKPDHEEGSRGLCDHDGFTRNSPGSQRDNFGTHD